jgi:acyl-CoA thioester hydrolase
MTAVPIEASIPFLAPLTDKNQPMPILDTNAIPTISQLKELPLQLSMAVPPEWEDRNGHVNVQYYLTLYELGGWVILEQVGIDDNWFKQNRVSMFDLEHHLYYLAEIRVNDQVSAYHRMLSRSEKRFHGVYFIVNDTTEQVASTLEYVTTCIDMRTRRTTPFPPELAAGVAKTFEEHQKLSWDAPCCGFMSA